MIILDWASFCVSTLWTGVVTLFKVLFAILVATIVIGFIPAYTGCLIYLLPASSMLWNLEVFLMNVVDYDKSLVNVLSPCIQYISDNHASLRLMIAIAGGIFAACLQWMIVVWLYLVVWFGKHLFRNQTIKK